MVTTYLALSKVAQLNGQEGIINGFNYMMHGANDHFHMILKRDNPDYPSLPGLTVLIGGMWIVNLNYWGCNQYITQRALGANLKTARSGILFAAFLKLLMPVIVVLPGIAAYVLHQKGLLHQEMMQAGETNPDRAYPVLLNLLPAGLKGLSIAALTAAIVASLAGKVNSISTIFTLDIYKKHLNKEASEKKLVSTGKLVVLLAMIIGVIIAPHLGIDKKGGFEFIQEYTGFVSPGIFAMFILGFFWKKATSNAALFATIGGFSLSFILKKLPVWGVNLEGLKNIGFSSLITQADGSKLWEIPFLDRMGIVFGFCIIGMAIISYLEMGKQNNPKGLEVDRSMFKTSPSFTVGALIIVGVLTALYSIFW